MEKLHYPSAKEWMWSYCTYLGPYRHKEHNYDLGVYIHADKSIISLAIVYGDEPGDYISGNVEYVTASDKVGQETIQRAIYADII
jgi:hypothetical protein